MNAGEWARVEMLGHRTVVGQCTEATIAGAPMLRIDIPSDPPGVVYAAPASLYCVTPISEEIARQWHAPRLELVDGHLDDDVDDGDYGYLDDGVGL